MLKIIYQDENLLVVDKPAGIVLFSEGSVKNKTLIDELLKKFPYLKNVGESPRYGIIHRLDKDTSGVLLIAKNNQALNFFQKQFMKKKVVKKYFALVVGKIESSKGEIKTLIGRNPRNRKKQKIFFPFEPLAKGRKLREAITKYRVVERFKDYTFLELQPKTGRKHQIRCHLNFIGHPIAGDKIYGFKGQSKPKGLKRQFLHASYIKINLPNGKICEFFSKLPEDLSRVLIKLKAENIRYDKSY